MGDVVKFMADGMEIEAEKGSSLLAALLRSGLDVPHLCYHPAVSAAGSCQLCLVEVTKGGQKRIVTSCKYAVLEDIEVTTRSEKITTMRRGAMERLLAYAPASEELKELAATIGVSSTPLPISVPENRCILCGLCERVCSEVIGVKAISLPAKGVVKKQIAPHVECSEACIGCGACTYVCPTGCLKVVERDGIREIPFLRAKHELALCQWCGGPVSTKAHLKHLAGKMALDRFTQLVCEECKKRDYARLVALEGHM